LSAHPTASKAAARLTRQLRELHGPLLFHLSCGCCDGTVPICLKQSDFRVGSSDVLLGEVEGVPFYTGGTHARWLADGCIVAHRPHHQRWQVHCVTRVSGLAPLRHGGGGGIRTPETLTGLTVFKTAGFNRSPTPPLLSITCPCCGLRNLGKRNKATIDNRRRAVPLAAERGGQVLRLHPTLRTGEETTPTPKIQYPQRVPFSALFTS
jgi:uncharacterized protein (DUF779 family)